MDDSPFFPYERTAWDIRTQKTKFLIPELRTQMMKKKPSFRYVKCRCGKNGKQKRLPVLSFGVIIQNSGIWRGFEKGWQATRNIVFLNSLDVA